MGQSDPGEPGALIEREPELGAIDDGIEHARQGEGELLVVHGPAGAGKTTLLGAARERAERDGMRVSAARGGELEAALPYGVVRALVDPILRRCEAVERERWLRGAARIAGSVLLGPDGDWPAVATDAFACQHGLYWFVSNLADERPTLLLVDDLHWADAPSLRFLAYLARRLDGLPLSIVVSIRTGEAPADAAAIRELLGGPRARLLAPAPLSHGGVGRILAATLGRGADEGFARACHHATGGNPFLVTELAAALRAKGVEPTAEAAARVESLSTDSIARTTLSRLASLSPDVVATAHALAALGLDATSGRAAELAGLDAERGWAAVDALVRVGLLDADVEFVHPIVRTAVHDDLGPGERSRLHSRAAGLLTREGADLDAVASHLLHTEPAGDANTVDTLRAAAARALARGAPDGAATYLARALEEGGGRELRAALLLELGQAEALMRSPDCLGHLDQARRLSTDSITRGRIALDQVQILVFAGAWDAPMALLDEALDELGDRDSELALELAAGRAAFTAYDRRLVPEFERRLSALQAAVAEAGPCAGALAMLLCGLEAVRGATPERARALFEQGWDSGRFMTDGGNPQLLPQGLIGLVVVGAADRAAEVVDTLRESARDRGSVVEFLVAEGYAALIAARGGDLTVAEAELRSGFERAIEHGLPFAIPTLLAYGIDVLLERPGAADLAAIADTVDPTPVAEVMNGGMVLWARGRLRTAGGDPAAVADLRAAAATFEALRFADPNFLPWRSTLALALPSADRAQAVALAQAELDAARRSGRPLGIGAALRALGVLERDGSEHLEESVRVLAASGHRLEHARSLVALGAATRRGGSRLVAREHLRAGLDLATRCGALRTAEHARAELSATGAKPRRVHLTGVESLTPSELRVARMAADGLTSQQIAESLFVSTKTIDTHLHHTYAKLGISSRTELPAALTGPPSRAGSTQPADY